MKEITYYIEKLLAYGFYNELFEENDLNFVRNQIISALNIESVYEEKIDFDPNEHVDYILEPLIDFAVENKIISENTQNNRDAFSAQLMGYLIGRPSEIISKFNSIKLKNSLKSATDWYYNFSQKTNYIQTGRIAKNISWHSKTANGDVDITINLSKPEKDPKDIAAALKQKTSAYPKCILCAENEGFKGNYNLPARQNHRIIPIELEGETWYFQYSPYVYFNEHSILLSKEHRPMKIDKTTFKRLLRFVQQFPHYFIGSNADLPIVGGSILSHDHFQAGRCDFPMTLAPIVRTFHSNFFKNVEVSIVKWKMSTIRLISENINKIVDLADNILQVWKNYSCPELEIVAFSGQTPHNTITPIARFRNNKYELDLVLRNNRTNEQNPDGIFHPHQHLHHIKKENIGLIEVMGLAILPGRLLEELDLIQKYLFLDIFTSDLIEKYPELQKHQNWIEHLRFSLKDKNIDLKQELRNQVAEKFIEVLDNCGVFKQEEKSLQYFYEFVESVIL